MIIKQSFFSIAGFLVPAIILLLSFQLFSNLFSPGELSILLILNTFAIIGTAFDLGLKLNLTKEIAIDINRKLPYLNTFFNYFLSILALSLLFSLILFFNKLFLLSYFNNLEIKSLNYAFSIFCIYFIIHHLSMCFMTFFEGMSDFKSSFYLKFFKAIFTNLFPLIVIYISGEHNFVFFLKLTLLGHFLSLFYCFFVLFSREGYNISQTNFYIFSIKKIQSVLKLSFHIFLNSLLGIMFMQLINIYVFSNFESQVSNIFKITSMLLGYINQFFASMFLVILPIFSKEKYGVSKEKIFKAFLLNSILSAVLYIFFYFTYKLFLLSFIIDSNILISNIFLIYLVLGYFISTTKFPLVLSSISFEKPQIISLHNFVNFLIIIGSIMYFNPSSIIFIAQIFCISQIISYLFLLFSWRVNFK